MSDEIEQRLRRLGNADVPRLDASRVDAIEQKLLAKSPPANRASWIVAAAAACVLLTLVITLSVRRDSSNTLQPTNSVGTTTETTLPQLEPTSTAGQSTTPTTVTATSSVGTSTVVVTRPPTETTADPTTTVALDTIPSASFALTIERVGSELRFSWPRYTEAGATRYVLVRVESDGLKSWPADDSRIAVTTTDLDGTSAAVTLRSQERRHWIVAVIGDDRHLIAISSVATSE